MLHGLEDVCGGLSLSQKIIAVTESTPRLLSVHSRLERLCSTATLTYGVQS